MYNITKAECKSLFENLRSTEHKLPVPEMQSTNFQQFLHKELTAPQKVSYFQRSPGPIQEVPQQMRSHVKSLRIRSSEVYGLLAFGSAFFYDGKNITEQPTPYSKKLWKCVDDDLASIRCERNSISLPKMERAISIEQEVIESLQKTMPDRMVIRKVTRIINPAMPFIVSTPDGVVFENGKPVGVLEVKTTRGRARYDSSGEILRWKSSKRGAKARLEVIRYTNTWWQMQCHMAVANVPWAALVSTSSRDKISYQIQIERDERAISEMLLRLHNMYFKELLPLFQSIAWKLEFD